MTHLKSQLKKSELNSNANLLERIEFTWKSINQTITKDANGLYNLTEVYKAGGFQESKKPSNWIRSNKRFIDRQLEKSRCSNMSIAFEVRKGGKNQGTWGNHRILQKYLQWLSSDYEDVVLDAVEALGAGKINQQFAINNTNATDSKMATSFNAYVRICKTYTKVKSEYLALADKMFYKKYGFSMLAFSELSVDGFMGPSTFTRNGFMISNSDVLPDPGFFSIENMRAEIQKSGFADIAKTPLRKICQKLEVPTMECRKILDDGQGQCYLAYQKKSLVEKLPDFLSKCSTNATGSQLIDPDGITFFYKKVLTEKEILI